MFFEEKLVAMKKILLVWLVLCSAVYGVEQNNRSQSEQRNDKKNQQERRGHKYRMEKLMKVFLTQVVSDVLLEEGTQHRLSDLEDTVSSDILEKRRELISKGNFVVKEKEMWVARELKVQGEVDKPLQEFLIAAKGAKCRLYNSREILQQAPLMVARVKYFREDAGYQKGDPNRWGIELLDLNIVTDRDETEKIWDTFEPWPEE